ncbi:MEDS domain-containing protein [Dactylosporangium sp. NPDC000555]|uniref:MEDS domain-containing protein n=1 Tax=Dactylosporangium sp. NPDC000555 TaxID=3154260 RepID=UPI00332D063F
MPEVGEGRERGAESLGRHVTVAYSTDEEIRDLLTGFVRRGVAAGHRVVILLDSDAADLGLLVAAAASGAAPGQFAALRFGAAQATGAGPPAFGGPGFGVPETLAMLSALQDETFAAGYPAVAIAGQMLWALRAGFTPGDLMTYETQWNRFFGDPRITGLCLYDRRRFAKDLIERVGAVHPGPLLGFTLGGWGAHLRLTGQVDASNGDSLPSILELVAGVDSVVLLDASDLSFVDVAGARTIVRFAASRPHRCTVVRCPRGVRQALRLVGAEAVPSLVLRDRVAGV